MVLSWTTLDCNIFIWFNMWSVTVLCASIQDQVLQSNVVQLKTKCYTLMCVNQWPNDTLQCGTPYKGTIIVSNWLKQNSEMTMISLIENIKSGMVIMIRTRNHLTLKDTWTWLVEKSSSFVYFLPVYNFYFTLIFFDLIRHQK